MSKKIAYIIPLHKKDERVFKAADSIPDTDFSIVVCPKDVGKWLTEKKKAGKCDNIRIYDFDVEPTYPKLVNLGLGVLLEDRKGFDGEIWDYISILEFDDTIMPNAHRIIDEYAEDWPDVEILAPLACVVTKDDAVDEDKPILVGVANEATLAPQIAEEFGLFDFNMMLRTNFLFVNGCYIKPSVFADYGKFKENFEIFYDYEWALRVVYNGGIIKTIPKATHFHHLSDGGAFETQKALPNETRENWLGATRREYFFEEDRNISFD